MGEQPQMKQNPLAALAEDAANRSLFDLDDDTQVELIVTAEVVTTPPEPEWEPNLFELLPDMIHKFKRMTLKGRPVFDSVGNTIQEKAPVATLLPRAEDEEITAVNIRAWRRGRL